MRQKSLADPFPLRLEPNQKATLEAEAKRLGIPLQELIRQRLDITHAVLAPINTMREELIYALRRGLGSTPADASGGGPSAIVNDALLVELLLSMRQVLSPAQLRDVQNNVVSLGLEPWTGEGAA